MVVILLRLDMIAAEPSFDAERYFDGTSCLLRASTETDTHSSPSRDQNGSYDIGELQDVRFIRLLGAYRVIQRAKNQKNHESHTQAQSQGVGKPFTRIGTRYILC